MAREKHITPSSKLVAKNNMQQSVLNNMSSSWQSSGAAIPCEEDVSSSHVETEKPNMNINQSVSIGARENDKQ